MREMWTIVTCEPTAWCTCLLFVHLHHAKTAAWIEVLFGVDTLRKPRNFVIDRGPDRVIDRGTDRVERECA